MQTARCRFSSLSTLALLVGLASVVGCASADDPPPLTTGANHEGPSPSGDDPAVIAEAEPSDPGGAVAVEPTEAPSVAGNEMNPGADAPVTSYAPPSQSSPSPFQQNPPSQSSPSPFQQNPPGYENPSGFQPAQNPFNAQNQPQGMPQQPGSLPGAPMAGQPPMGSMPGTSTPAGPPMAGAPGQLQPMLSSPGAPGAGSLPSAGGPASGFAPSGPGMASPGYAGPQAAGAGGYAPGAVGSPQAVPAAGGAPGGFAAPATGGAGAPVGASGYGLAPAP